MFAGAPKDVAGINTCPHTVLEHQTVLFYPYLVLSMWYPAAAGEGCSWREAGAEHSDKASRGSSLARKGPVCTVPGPGERSVSAGGNQALPGVQVAREVCGDEADPSSSQEFKVWITEVPACSSAVREILSLK